MLQKTSLKKQNKMSFEHVRLSPEEQVFGQGHLLQTQLDLINSGKNMKEYKVLRKEEFNLKVELKAKIEQTLQNLDIFDKMLPKARMKEEIHKELEVEKARTTLEDEAEQIRRKLSILNASYQ